MLNAVPLPPKHLADYAPVVGADAIARLHERAERFRGARVLHLSASSFGGGIAEMLYAHVPLMRDLGLHVDWRILDANDEFFTVTRAMHNGLHGSEVAWTDHMQRLYVDLLAENARVLHDAYDFVIVHDPPPTAMLQAVRALGKPAADARWIWRCHIDLSTPFDPVWRSLADALTHYDAAVFTMEEFIAPRWSGPAVSIIPPSIDPLSLKNVPLELDTTTEVLNGYGVDPLRPLLVQVSRFDPWKDPLGVMDAYRLAKKEFPGLQLTLIASMAPDDPDAFHWYARAEDYREGDDDIRLLSNLQDVGSLGVNAFQRAADVIVQKSIREGFGHVVAEGMWKSKPVVAGNVGGLRLQIVDGETGYLVSSVEECAERIVDVLREPKRANAMGAAARARVRERFLSPRDIGDYLTLFESLS